MKGVRSILDQNAFSFTDNSGDPEINRLVAKRLETVGPTSMLFYRKPLHIVKGEGVWLYDAAGERYLDVYNNVQSVGHCHPRVVEAVSRQMAELNVHTRYLHEGIHRYAGRLLETMPAPLDRMVMTCTGSESNDMALRLVRHYTGRQGIIVTEAAYHGNTTAVTEISPSSLKKRDPAEHVYVVPVAGLTAQGENAGHWFAEQVREGIRTLDSRGYGCAALIVDTIFSSDGVFADPAGFLQEAVGAVQAQGGLFIADEVQPGFGRTGDAMWGFARHALQPDVVTMGKPMGNGFPMSAVVAREALLAALAEEEGYFNTFGGNSVAVAAGNAVLDVIEDEGLMQNAKAVGHYLKTALQVLARDFAELGDIRGAGLFIGVDFVDADGDPDAGRATAVINELRNKGVLIGAAGKYGNSLKIRPPLVFSQAHADIFIERLSAAVLATR
ncbi:aspartate aminotransferase family protein [Granulosicoccaceae sp. 1_MG-2023]|nr:aspartate aminotransferase family protein [Granulosicoccaceae sp. 1_MG-2023]